MNRALDSDLLRHVEGYERHPVSAEDEEIIWRMMRVAHQQGDSVLEACARAALIGCICPVRCEPKPGRVRFGVICWTCHAREALRERQGPVGVRGLP